MVVRGLLSSALQRRINPIQNPFGDVRRGRAPALQSGGRDRLGSSRPGTGQAPRTHEKISCKVGASFIALIEIIIIASSDAPFVFPEFSTINLISSDPE